MVFAELWRCTVLNMESIGRRARLVAVACLAALLAGCGGSFINGPILSAPALSESRARELASPLGVPDDRLWLNRPVAVRVCPGGEAIVDVAVSSSSYDDLAGFSTNGLNVPAERQSDGREGEVILIQRATGKPLKGWRALPGLPGFEEPGPEFSETSKLARRVIRVDRAGKAYTITFVPVLLGMPEKLVVGEEVDVRIRPMYERDGPEYAWYRLKVEAAW